MATPTGLLEIGRLWSTVRVWAWLYIGAAIILIAAYGYRFSSLQALPPETYMTEMDVLPGTEVGIFVIAIISVVFFVFYVVAAILTLIWYRRAVRNARIFSHGTRTSPAMAVWGFLIPIVSLVKPYSMTSELWRSALSPQKWKSLNDPSVLRWWWGAVLLGSLTQLIGDFMSRSAVNAGELMISIGTLMVGGFLHVLAGLAFIRIGNAISKNQTQHVTNNTIATPPTDRPSWAS